MNLFYATGSDLEGVKELVAELKESEAAQAFVVEVGAGWTRIECVAGGQPIFFEGKAAETPSAAAALLALRQAGSPTALIWDVSLLPDHPLLISLGRECDRVITSMIRPCASTISLQRWFDLRRRLGSRPLISDLFESLVNPWQREISRIMTEHDSASICEVAFYFASDSLPADMLLVGAWIATVLGWTDESIISCDDRTDIAFARDRSMIFVKASKTDGTRVELHFDDSQDTPFICEEPEGEVLIVELLREQLSSMKRNPVRESSLERAEKWIRELTDR
ncbi:glucose-6-phosphate dehydrogenase assembly protein OpcA [bacterium]|nr:glucose-6-phosphate dehydrogenase assembly protein OpcA [bacterium]MBU1984670.1 glucose-6-phosphate dehydrogenase assembly protein OpcA [bacterium]